MYDDEKVIALGSGVRSVRFRPSLAIGSAVLGRAVDALDRVLTAIESEDR
jgi:L-lysine 6-transaminase